MTRKHLAGLQGRKMETQVNAWFSSGVPPSDAVFERIDEE